MTKSQGLANSCTRMPFTMTSSRLARSVPFPNLSDSDYRLDLKQAQTEQIEDLDSRLT